MKVGYAVLYKDGELTISKEYTILQKPIYKDYGEFEDRKISWKNDKKKIKQVRILNQIKSNYMQSWFEDCYNLTTLIDFQNLDVSDCEDFSYVFHGCELLTDISSLKNWNVSNCMDFAYMFCQCKLLISISTLSTWDVSKCKDFSNMFASCSKLKEVNLNNWNVLNGKRFHAIFSECSNLCIVNISKWNMSHVEYFDYMFLSCENLKEIWLSDTITLLSEKTFNLCNLNLKIHWRNKIYTYADLIEYQEF